MKCFAHTFVPALALACATIACLLGKPAFASPIISEVLYDAVGSDDGQSFVELYGVPGTSLDGLFLEGINGAGGSVTISIALTGTISADGFYLLADIDGGGVTLVPSPDALANFDFQNGPDSVVLRDGSGGVLDAVGYGVFDAGDVFAGEGSPVADAPAGSSIARFFADVDTDDNAFDFTVLGTPTPGSGPLSVPEPSTGLLAISALAGIGAMERRRSPEGQPRRLGLRGSDPQAKSR
jgi:hypothetical protein